MIDNRPSWVVCLLGDFTYLVSVMFLHILSTYYDIYLEFINLNVRDLVFKTGIFGILLLNSRSLGTRFPLFLFFILLF